MGVWTNYGYFHARFPGDLKFMHSVEFQLDYNYCTYINQQQCTLIDKDKNNVEIKFRVIVMYMYYHQLLVPVELE